MKGDYYYWIVNSSFPQGFPTSVVYDGEALTDKYSGTKVTCTDKSEGVIYEDDGSTLEINGFDVIFNGVKSTNLLSTSDWNSEHTATTDGSSRLVRPQSVEFEIVNTPEYKILLRGGMVDVCIKKQ